MAAISYPSVTVSGVKPDLDMEISSLSNLLTLSLKYNRIDYLPPHLARLYPHLKLLELEGNPCYEALVPKRRRPRLLEDPISSPQPPQNLRKLPSFSRLRHSKSSPNLAASARSRSRAASTAPSPRDSGSRESSPDSSRKSFFKSIGMFTPPLPSFTPKRSLRPATNRTVSEDSRKARQAELVGIAKDLNWPVGLAPEPLLPATPGSRNSESSESSDSSEGSSPASSVSSPLKPVNKSVLPLQGIDEITVDQQQLTKCILSRLRDLWELTNGHVCLADGYVPHREDAAIEIDDFAKGLGIELGESEKSEEMKEASTVTMRDTSKKRSNIVREIIETEESYIRGLEELVEVNLFHARLTLDLH